MLEPIFGESGAVVAEFFIILILVLILMGLGYWLYRQYGGVALGGGGKGRVPRLAVIDSLSIDHRHRLVLVRRDNIEHLLLIGKTADLVVEPSIVRNLPAGVRPRQGQTPRPQPQKKGAAPQPRPAPAGPSRRQPPAPQAPQVDETGISEPIPFPQGRRQQARPELQQAQAHALSNQAAAAESAAQPQAAAREMPASTVGAVSAASASAHFAETTRPTRVDSAFSLADALDEIADEPVDVRDAAEQSAPATASQPIEPVAEDADSTATDLPEHSATEQAASGEPAAKAVDAAADTGSASETAGEDRATKVSNLEQEMARLLGEITAKRDA